ncbi:lysozyme inhibitor LprI family protein [Cupriavidus oxalaticus]|uniref:lysozyme inhibitor LprI family protein n=1 Tax=Cupriavidus oxalaticus TaxID=96344 RepID=UPI00316B885B
MALGLAGCGEEKKTSLLDDISGVWKAKGENALMTIQYTDKKVRLLFDDTFIPVTVGDTDEQNRTVNFNVKSATGKPGVWTVRQIWDNKEKTSFHLGITLHDGSQEEFGFVRKISTDDLNRIASLEVKSQPAPSPQPAQQVAAATASVVTPPPATPETNLPQAQAEAPAALNVVATPAPATAFAPSFDCAKASNGPERLICSNQELAELDVELVQAYKRLLSAAPDKDSVKKEQNSWRKNERDACSAAACMAKAYRDRIDNLITMSQYYNKPAQFR